MNDTDTQLSKWQRFRKTIVWEYTQLIVVVLILVFGFIRPFVVEAFKIPSGSMKDTLLIGDRILVCKFIYGVKIPGTDIKMFDFHKPARGDVFVFIPPHDRKRHFIKRIVAVAGDTIQTRGKTLYVNGAAVDDSHYTKYVKRRRDDFPPEYLTKGKPFTVPKGKVFAMGDNRDDSSDSRAWGPVDVSDIKGQAFMVYWSYDAHLGNVRFGRIGKLIHAYP